MTDIILSSTVKHDEYTEIAHKCFDVPKSDTCTVIVKNNLSLPDKWNIGLIYGPSGSGKSSLLKTLGTIKSPSWDDTAIISNFRGLCSPEDASILLSSMGLSDIPSWLKPYHVLSNGEKFRADMARVLVESKEIALVDEFTSVVDRNVAKSASNAINKYVHRVGKQLIVASCHNDIVEWLRPDWIYDTSSSITHVPRDCLQRPEIKLEIFPCKYEAWELFQQHHYLTAKLNKAARTFAASWNGTIVAFIGVLALPHAKLKNAWRVSRIVVLPDFQGLGIGMKLCDYMGSLISGGGGSFYIRAAHAITTAYLLKHEELWKLSSSKPSGKNSASSGMNHGNGKRGAWIFNDDRPTMSFKYVGPPASAEDSKLFWDYRR